MLGKDFSSLTYSPFMLWRMLVYGVCGCVCYFISIGVLNLDSLGFFSLSLFILHVCFSFVYDT